jgi:hypothetical protein
MLEHAEANASMEARQPLGIHVIEPNAIYTLASARAALGLTKTTLGREVRLGRLRAARRGGKYFILGAWLLEWLEAGEVHRYVRRPQANTEQIGGSHENP